MLLVLKTERLAPRSPLCLLYFLFIYFFFLISCSTSSKCFPLVCGTQMFFFLFFWQHIYLPFFQSINLRLFIHIPILGAMCVGYILSLLIRLTKLEQTKRVLLQIAEPSPLQLFFSSYFALLNESSIKL